MDLQFPPSIVVFGTVWTVLCSPIYALGWLLGISTRSYLAWINWEAKQWPHSAMGDYGETWNNKRGRMANIKERLDQGIANAEWKFLFSEAVITHLPALNSDHKPILLQTNPPTVSAPKPFKFESMWITHADTGFIIEEEWNRHRPFPFKLKDIKLELKEWYRKVYGNVQETIKNLRDSI